MHVVALLTSHDRRDKTLACLSALERQHGEHRIDAVLVDAASTDGTASAVREAHPWVAVHEVGDDVFWNGGTHRAWQIALGQHPDAYLWLNDDTILDDDALDVLVAALDDLADRPASVVVGSTRDPETGELTYGGVERPDPRRPLKYRLVEPGDEPRRALTMNGNCVLIPRAVVELVGIMDPGYRHGMGDFDYGHRVVAAGGEVWVAPGTVGTCPRNPKRPATTSVREEWQRLRRPTGLPPADFARYARRWVPGPAWPVYWASPYVRRLAKAAVRRPAEPGADEPRSPGSSS